MRRASRFLKGSGGRRWQWLALGAIGAMVLYLSSTRSPGGPSVQPAYSPLTLAPEDRLLILAPHPDDETICCGGIIQQAVAQHLPVHVVFFTYGDNNEWSFLLYRHHPIVVPGSVRRMGLVRHDEALAAAKVLGLAPEQLTFLGYPDFSTLSIWNEHWGDRPPLRSMLTRVTAVPYKNALRVGAPYKGEEVLRDLTTVLREFHPTKVFVSHPGDYMPDHRALYLFTRVALWDLQREMAPVVYPYLVHFPHWPRPRGYHPTILLRAPGIFREEIAWQSWPLGSEMIARKRQALEAHRTQMGYSARYLLAFARTNELFGELPAVAMRNVASAMFAGGEEIDEKEAAEQLTEQERAAFVGVELRSIYVEAHDVVLSIGFSRPLAETVAVSVHLFGYRSDRPFAEMPKLHVRFGALRHDVYDQTRRLPSDTVRVSRGLKHLTVRVPVDALGRPQRILLSARSYVGAVPLDLVSWRVIDLAGDAEGTAHARAPSAGAGPIR